MFDRFTVLLTFFCMSFTSGVDGKPSSCGTGITINSNQGTVKFPSVSTPTSVSKIKTEYDSQGLQPFFDLANSFMNTVQDDPPPKLEIKDLLNQIQNDATLRDKIVKYETPIFITAGFGILFAIFFPLVGFIFCCCRCCGNCGGEMVQSEKDSKNHTKCCICSVILFCLVVFMLCGVLFMYVTNNRLHAAVGETDKVYDNALDEGFSFMNTTLDELEMLKDKQLLCTIGLISEDVSDAGVKTRLGEPIKKLLEPRLLPAINTVIGSTQNVTAMRTNLQKLLNGTDKLKSAAQTLSRELNSTRDELNSIKTDCASTPAASQCNQISTNDLQSEANFATLPDVSSELSNIRKIVDQNFSGAALESRKVFDNIPQTVADKAASALTDIRKLVNDGEKKVNETFSDYTNRVSDILKKRKDFESYKTHVDDAKKYDKFRWYGFIGLSSIMGLIVLFLAIGLTLGICGYDKSVYTTHRSATSNHGGNCLMAAVGFMFIFSWIFFYVTTIFFLLGIHLHIGCSQVKNGKIIDQYADLKINGTEINVHSMLESCRKGDSAFSAIGGNKIINIDEKLNITKQLGNIDGELEKIKNQVNFNNQNILSNDTRSSLKDLSTSSVDNINFATFLNEFKKRIVVANLTQLAANITSLATSIRSLNQSSTNSLAVRLEAVAGNLTKIQSTTIETIKNLITTLETDVNNLKALSNGLKTATTKILDDLEKADSYLKNNASDAIFTEVKKFKDRVIGWADQFAKHVISEVKNNIGNCRPISNIFDGVINAHICGGLVGNLNGFWLACGWCLFFFTFVVIFAVKLAKYFRRMKYLNGFEHASLPPPYSDYKDTIPMSDYNRPPPYNHYNNQSYAQ